MPRPKKRSPPDGTFAWRMNKAWEATAWPLTRLSAELRRSGRDLRGVSHSHLGRYLDDGLEPSLDVARALADVLGVSPQWLLTGEGLPDPDGMTDHVRPLWRIDGPMGAEEGPESPTDRETARTSFEEGFRAFSEEWQRLSPTVRVLFGNLLARRMLAARNEGDPWREPFWRGQEAARIGQRLLKRAHGQAEKEGVQEEVLDSPAYSDIMLRLIAIELHEWRDRANPRKEDTHE